MRMWEPGDPIEGGNEIGIPDIPYFEYLRVGSDDDYYNSPSRGSDYSEPAPKKHFTSDELIEKAERLFSYGDYNGALECYEQVLDRSYSEKAKCGKAECLHKLGYDDEASKIDYEIGDSYAWGSDDEKNIAIRYLKRSLEFNPNNEDSLDVLAYSLRQLGRYEKALIYYNRIRHKDVDWAMAMCYMGLKKYESAIPLLNKIIEDNRHRDDFLDQKCECLINLGRKYQAVELCKDFIDFLMKNECYERAIDRLDLLSRDIPNDDFIRDRRETCLKNKEKLEIRFKSILKVMNNYHMYNPNGLDENDLKGFMKFVCEESGESVDDIVRWYTTPMLGSSSFRAICGDVLHYSHWDKIVDMYEEGKLRDVI